MSGAYGRLSVENSREHLPDLDEFGVFTMSQKAFEPNQPIDEGPTEGGGRGYRKSKIINDPVWGHIRIPGLCCDVIDTPEFQRLRELKQLGTSYYVFPGASHNRFEHSLGVCHKAEEMALHINRIQGDELEMNGSDVKVVSLAGLCHDLGHGPFSHVFDNEFLPQVHGPDISERWSHEGMSAQLFEYLVDKNHIDGISREEIKRVQDIIKSSEVKGGGYQNNPKAFLYDIVANGRNSIDVDKFDYIARDAYYCGVKGSWDSSRILPMIKVIDNEICFKAKEAPNIYELFNTRASLHRRVYTHAKAKAIEYMVVDAMLAAESIFKIKDKIWDPADYVSLDDTILKRIEHGEHMALRPAQDIIKRIRTRDLYKFCNEFLVPTSRLADFKRPTAADVVACQSQDGTCDLRPEDIVVQNLSINYSMKDKNPVDNVSFFKDYPSTEKFRIPKEKISAMIPTVFQERIVRVFSKSSDGAKVQAASRAFEEFQRRNGYGSGDDIAQVHSTPIKGSRHKRMRPLDENSNPA